MSQLPHRPPRQIPPPVRRRTMPPEPLPAGHQSRQQALWLILGTFALIGTLLVVLLFLLLGPRLSGGVRPEGIAAGTGQRANHGSSTGSHGGSSDAPPGRNTVGKSPKGSPPLPSADTPRPPRATDETARPGATDPVSSSGSSRAAKAPEATTENVQTTTLATAPPQTPKVPQGARGDAAPAAGDPSGVAAGAARFFGIAATGHVFVYVIDCSSSMDGARTTKARTELLRSIQNLEETQEFYVFFFASASYPMFFPGPVARGALRATLQNKIKVTKWIKGFGESGGTEPEESLVAAIRMDPDAIFFLTDGEFDAAVVDRVAELARKRRRPVPIHCICLESKQGEVLLKELAERTGGTYTYIP